MNRFEFNEWFQYHSSAFVSVNNYFCNLKEDERNRTLHHWYRLLGHCQLEKCKRGTDAMFENEPGHPRRIDQHPGRIKNFALETDRLATDMTWLREAKNQSPEELLRRKGRNKEVVRLISQLIAGDISKEDFADHAEDWDDSYPGHGWRQIAERFGNKVKPPF